MAFGDARPPQSGERLILDLGVMRLSSTLGGEMTLQIKCLKNNAEGPCVVRHFPLAMGNQPQALLDPGQMQTLPKGQSIPDSEGKHAFLSRRDLEDKVINICCRFSAQLLPSRCV